METSSFSLGNASSSNNAWSPSIGASAVSTESSGTTITGFFSSFTWTTWVVIILILAFLGFNVFAYLTAGTQTLADFLGFFAEKLFGSTAVVAGQAIDVSAEGAKAVVSETADVIETGLTAVQNAVPNGATAKSTVKGQPVTSSSADPMQQSSLNKALNSGRAQTSDYEASEATSSVHTAGKAGWCYVGMDRGFRTCAEVGVNDTCMSGDIFPSQEICMNPSLRA